MIPHNVSLVDLPGFLYTLAIRNTISMYARAVLVYLEKYASEISSLLCISLYLPQPHPQKYSSLVNINLQEVTDTGH
jgi:GTP-binding protein EngB required for normal cell division